MTIEFKAIKILALILCAAVAFVSCSSRQNQHDPDEKKYDLKLKVPTNRKYYYTITNDVNTIAEANGEEAKSRRQSTVGLIYLVEKDSAGQYLVHITYDKLHVLLNNKDGETELDAANAGTSSNPIEKLLGTIAGNTITVKVDNNGKILHVSGSKEIMDKIIAL